MNQQENNSATAVALIATGIILAVIYYTFNG